MSLASKILIPKLESELLNHEPEIQDFLLKAIHQFATDIILWAESKITNQGAKNEA